MAPLATALGRELSNTNHRAINYSGELVGSKSFHPVEPTLQSRMFSVAFVLVGCVRVCQPRPVDRFMLIAYVYLSYQNRFIPRCIPTSFVDFAKKLIFLLTYDKSGTIVFIKLFND